jgi:hypothetical protein
MFNFLKRRREAAQRASIEAQRAVIIADCERALDRISRAGWEFVGAQEVASHIAKANAVGLLKHETVARLELLQRLNAAALENPGPTVNDNLLTEAARLGLEDTSAARFIRRRRRLEVFRERGPEIVSRDPQGRPVHFECEAEFRNKPGTLAIRQDGLTFTGEVIIEVLWVEAAHVAPTTHTYRGSDYSALAVQERKRRTATKFALNQSDADYVCELAALLWERSRNASQQHLSQSPPAPAASTEPPIWDDNLFGYLAAVGESNYQAALTRIAQTGRLCWATLVPEPTNPFDGNAVMVQIQGEVVGYLTRSEARRYQRQLLALTEPLLVPAKLIGGTADKPSFGVLLDCRAVESLPKPKRARQAKKAIDPMDQPF